jgi:hypothetical protein
MSKPRRKYHVGEVFGKWTLLRPNGKGAWHVQCSCGYEGVCSSHAFRTGRSTQCIACSYGVKSAAERSGRILPSGESGFRRKLRTCKRQAKERSLSWNITDEETKQLFLSNCHYCDAIPAQQVYGEQGDAHGLFVANGIDRVINEIGYEPDNCVPCCGPCNRAKDTMTSDEFIAMARRITNKHKALSVYV